MALFLVMALLASCGDDGGASTADGNGSADRNGPVDGGNSPAEPSSDASSDENSDASDDGGDQPVASGSDPTGTVEIDGEVHQLSADPDNPYVQCAITDQAASVVGLVSPDGIEVVVAGGSIWSASVKTPTIHEGSDWQLGKTWDAASHDPPLNSDATRELSPGRVVIDGTWGDESTGVDTAQIRLEVNC